MAEQMSLPVIKDLSGRGLKKIEKDIDDTDDTLCTALVLDNNFISKLESLSHFDHLQQLSVANNRLVEINGISQLRSLKVLNLPDNSIQCIEGLPESLEWLNLSGNSIKTIENVEKCNSLHHLDLSDNSISFISNISMLTSLKTLMLHGNILTSLSDVSKSIPSSLEILSLANNEISDLNHVMYLSSLPNLKQLSLKNNPCVFSTTNLFDYRPFVLNWCPKISILDGHTILQKEILKADWLLNQGNGRKFLIGQHIPLVDYLSIYCPLTTMDKSDPFEDEQNTGYAQNQLSHQYQVIKVADIQGEQNTDLQLEKNVTKKITSPRTAPVKAWLEESLSEDIRSEELESPKRWSNDKLELIDSNDESGLLYSESQFITSDDNTNISMNRSNITPFSHLQREDTSFTSRNDDKQSIQLFNSPTTFHKTNFLTHQQYDDQLIKPANPQLYPPKNSTSINEEDVKRNLFKSGRKRMKENQESDKIRSTRKNMLPYQTAKNSSDYSSYNPKLKNIKKVIEKRKEKINQQLLDDYKSDFVKNQAAIKIQSAWRGYYIRNCCEKNIKLFENLRTYRIEQYIQHIFALIKSLKKQCLHEKKIQNLQNGAIKYLLSQVEGLQNRLSAIYETSGQAYQKSEKHLKDREQTMDLTPQPPHQLFIEQKTENSILLTWEKVNSNLYTVLSYSVFMNSNLVGRIDCSDPRALIEGLQPGHSYRFTVSTITDIGESSESSAVVVFIASQNILFKFDAKHDDKNNPGSGDGSGGTGKESDNTNDLNLPIHTQEMSFTTETDVNQKKSNHPDKSCDAILPNEKDFSPDILEQPTKNNVTDKPLINSLEASHENKSSGQKNAHTDNMSKSVEAILNKFWGNLLETDIKNNDNSDISESLENK